MRTMSVVRVVSEYGHPFGVAKRGDVGHDLYVTIIGLDCQTWVDRLVSWVVAREVIVVWPLVGVRMVSSGIFLSMPDGVWCRVRERSSTSRKKLEILGGNIDSGYRGELYTVIHNLGLLPRLLTHGERYAQVIFHEAVRPSIQHIDEFTDHDLSQRGDSGFGSTGK